LKGKRAEELFTHQCLAGVDAAITRLFDDMPIDRLKFRVLDRSLSCTLVAGNVRRRDLPDRPGQSVRMKLKTIGVEFVTNGVRLEPLSL